MNRNQFQRTELLLGPAAMEKLAASRVAVFGVGGVGGYVVEGLARSGIGALDLIDCDKVSLTNLNRQIIATHDTLGMDKTEVAKARVLSINPECRVTAHNVFYLPETADQINLSDYDYIVDCIDTVSAKLELVMRAKETNVPIISSMGTGNKIDPSKLRIADISETSVCPLARVMRQKLRKRGIYHLKCVFSTEEPATVSIESGSRHVPGSVAFVPSVAGLIIASEVIKDLLK